MKKIYILIILISAFKINFAHDQHVHMYLVEEGYELLKLYINGYYSEMETRIGSDQIGPQWTNGTIKAGAWREDEEDIVYGTRWPSIAFSSVTHFWDADHGDNHPTDLGIIALPDDLPNAYQKIEALYKPEGNWEIQFEPGSGGQYSFQQQTGGSIIITTTKFRLKYTDLIDLYKTGRMKISGWYRIGEGWVTSNHDVYIYEDWKNMFVWELLGRMCHLLQDMSVPAHVHNDEHGTSPDSYEDYISESNRWKNYTASSCNNELINPYDQANHPLHYLMYITNQLTDHFSSNDGNGDDNILGNYTATESQKISTFNISSWGNPTGSSRDFSNANKDNIADKTMPLAIKATAGLLYWFATEANLTKVVYSPLSSNITGPSRAECQTSTWYSNASGGQPPYTYKWYHKWGVDGGGEFKIKTRAPSGEWLYQGDSENLSMYLCGGDSQLKVEVTDNSGTTVTDIHTVWSGANMAKSTDDEFPLEENISSYPNPFNPSTQIKYTLKENSIVKIKVFNSLGQEVALLVNEEQPEGNYKVQFDASNYPSGIYYCQMITAGFSKTIKLILTK